MTLERWVEEWAGSRYAQCLQWLREQEVTRPGDLAHLSAEDLSIMASGMQLPFGCKGRFIKAIAEIASPSPLFREVELDGPHSLRTSAGYSSHRKVPQRPRAASPPVARRRQRSQDRGLGKSVSSSSLRTSSGQRSLACGPSNAQRFCPWRVHLLHDGRTMYYNVHTGETQWKLPEKLCQLALPVGTAAMISGEGNAKIGPSSAMRLASLPPPATPSTRAPTARSSPAASSRPSIKPGADGDMYSYPRRKSVASSQGGRVNFA